MNKNLKRLKRLDKKQASKTTLKSLTKKLKKLRNKIEFHRNKASCHDSLKNLHKMEADYLARAIECFRYEKLNKIGVYAK